MAELASDVAIIGAGPGGSTCGAFLRKHNPDLHVSVFEREHFPREHVGESQLPIVSQILNELGVWDRVEECLFPIKIGATYRWGNSDDLWDFEFLPFGKLEDQPRPARFAGQRTMTAFQVDRSVYDKVLADYASELGCAISYGCPVREVVESGDRVEGLVLGDGSMVVAKYYIDASGHSGLVRRAMGVEIEEPSALKNIAVWDYWRNAEWAVSIGIGGTRVQVLPRLRLAMVHPHRPRPHQHRLRLPRRLLQGIRAFGRRPLCEGARRRAQDSVAHQERLSREPFEHDQGLVLRRQAHGR